MGIWRHWKRITRRWASRPRKAKAKRKATATNSDGRGHGLRTAPNVCLCVSFSHLFSWYWSPIAEGEGLGGMPFQRRVIVHTIQAYLNFTSQVCALTHNQ